MLPRVGWRRRRRRSSRPKPVLHPLFVETAKLAVRMEVDIYNIYNEQRFMRDREEGRATSSEPVILSEANYEHSDTHDILENKAS
jgi:hypothetical protein